MKKTKYYIYIYRQLRRVPQSNRHSVETKKKLISFPHIYKTAPSPRFATGTSIKSGGRKLVLWTQTSNRTEMIRSQTTFQQYESPRESKIDLRFG